MPALLTSTTQLAVTVVAPGGGTLLEHHSEHRIVWRAPKVTCLPPQLVAGGAPLAQHIEDFMRVCSCAAFMQASCGSSPASTAPMPWRAEAPTSPYITLEPHCPCSAHAPPVLYDAAACFRFCAGLRLD